MTYRPSVVDQLITLTINTMAKNLSLSQKQKKLSKRWRMKKRIEMKALPAVAVALAVGKKPFGHSVHFTLEHFPV